MKQRAMVILDGGMGRELQRSGAPFRQPEWSALALSEAPEAVVGVHAAFIAAGRTDSEKERRTTMLSWAITFLIIAIVAAVLGFGGIAGAATGIAKILFIVFLVLFVASFFFGRGRG